MTYIPSCLNRYECSDPNHLKTIEEAARVIASYLESDLSTGFDVAFTAVSEFPNAYGLKFDENGKYALMDHEELIKRKVNQLMVAGGFRREDWE